MCHRYAADKKKHRTRKINTFKVADHYHIDAFKKRSLSPCDAPVRIFIRMPLAPRRSAQGASLQLTPPPNVDSSGPLLLTVASNRRDSSRRSDRAPRHLLRVLYLSHVQSLSSIARMHLEPSFPGPPKRQRKPIAASDPTATNKKHQNVSSKNVTWGPHISSKPTNERNRDVALRLHSSCCEKNHNMRTC